MSTTYARTQHPFQMHPILLASPGGSKFFLRPPADHEKFSASEGALSIDKHSTSDGGHLEKPFAMEVTLVLEEREVLVKSKRRSFIARLEKRVSRARDDTYLGVDYFSQRTEEMKQKSVPGRKLSELENAIAVVGATGAAIIQPQARLILVGETVKTVAWKSLDKERFERIFGDHETERISRRVEKSRWFKPGNLWRAWSYEVVCGEKSVGLRFDTVVESKLVICFC